MNCDGCRHSSTNSKVSICAYEDSMRKIEESITSLEKPPVMSVVVRCEGYYPKVFPSKKHNEKKETAQES